MICKHCGTENKAGVKFCKKCGKPMQAAPAAQNTVKSASRPASSPGLQINGKLIGIAVGAVVVVAGIVLGVKLIGGLGPTIDLNKYLVIEMCCE